MRRPHGANGGGYVRRGYTGRGVLLNTWWVVLYTAESTELRWNTAAAVGHTTGVSHSESTPTNTHNETAAFHAATFRIRVPQGRNHPKQHTGAHRGRYFLHLHADNKATTAVSTNKRSPPPQHQRQQPTENPDTVRFMKPCSRKPKLSIWKTLLVSLLMLRLWIIPRTGARQASEPSATTKADLITDAAVR